MENQPQNPEFRNNPENFHPCKDVCNGVTKKCRGTFSSSLRGNNALIRIDKFQVCVINFLSFRLNIGFVCMEYQCIISL